MLAINTNPNTYIIIKTKSKVLSFFLFCCVTLSISLSFDYCKLSVDLMAHFSYIPHTHTIVLLIFNL